MNKISRELSYPSTGITSFQTIDKNGRKGRWVLKLFDTNTGEIFTDFNYKEPAVFQVNPQPRFGKCEEDALNFRDSNDKKFTSSEYKVFGDLNTVKKQYGENVLRSLLMITKKVKVHNVAFIKRSELCDIFSCSNSNLNRKLNSLVKNNLIKFYTKEVTAPKTIKILLNPFLFWYGASKSKVVEWLNYWCSESPVHYDTVTPSEDYIKTVSVEDFKYSDSYDVGIYDDNREYMGDKSYLVSECEKEILSEDKLIYLLYDV